MARNTIGICSQRLNQAKKERVRSTSHNMIITLLEVMITIVISLERSRKNRRCSRYISSIRVIVHFKTIIIKLLLELNLVMEDNPSKLLQDHRMTQQN